jgi:hypothetical protein
MLQEIPDGVVDQCLKKDQKDIILIDEKNSKSYECLIETVNGESNVKYIAKGWFKCMDEMGLKDGDEVLFTMENPSEAIYVYLFEWDD